MIARLQRKLEVLPFMTKPLQAGPGATHRDSRKMADIELDCSIHLNNPVFLEHIDIFENSNAGKVGVYVYEPASAERLLSDSKVLRPLREPAVCGETL